MALLFLAVTAASPRPLHPSSYLRATGSTTLRGFAGSIRSCAPPAATLSFRQHGEPEANVADVALTRSRDGSTGTATFRFDRASILDLDDVWSNGLITGLWLRDEEGHLCTTDVTVEFERGKPRGVVAILVLKSTEEWARFMRYMKRYAEANGLEFASAIDR